MHSSMFMLTLFNVLNKSYSKVALASPWELVAALLLPCCPALFSFALLSIARLPGRLSAPAKVEQLLK